jgi:hypothetical protein
LKVGCEKHARPCGRVRLKPDTTTDNNQTRTHERDAAGQVIARRPLTILAAIRE